MFNRPGDRVTGIAALWAGRSERLMCPATNATLAGVEASFEHVPRQVKNNLLVSGLPQERAGWAADEDASRTRWALGRPRRSSSAARWLESRQSRLTVTTVSASRVGERGCFRIVVCLPFSADLPGICLDLSWINKSLRSRRSCREHKLATVQELNALRRSQTASANRSIADRAAASGTLVVAPVQVLGPS
jgi:hypothetical protein